MNKEPHARPSIWAVLLLAASIAFLVAGITLFVFG
jgi:hypothetical protein